MSSIMRWNPFREMAEMQRQMDRLFDDVWAGNWPRVGAWSALQAPALDIHETDADYHVVVPLPGVKPEQIDVRLQNGMLTISGELPQPEVDDKTKVVMQERVFGKFSRSITLPQAVDQEHVEATYENGVLTLTLPKSPEAQPKQITVKTGKLLADRN